jgi:hypothetical protein
MRYLIFLLSLALSSCSVPVYILLYNNSGTPVMVKSGDSTLTISPSSQETFPISMTGPISLHTEQATYIFPHPSVPNNFVEPRKGEKARLRLQLQPDFSIIAAKPEAALPISKETPQPKGFPLLPAKGQP